MSITSIDRAKLFAEPTALVRPLVLWVMRVAAVVAAVVSGYLAWISLTGASGLGCSGGFDCDEVLSSRWSHWFGIPVALPAVSLYASLLLTLAFAGPLTPEKVRRLAWTVSVWLSALAGAAALWFVGLQLLVVGRFCSWCLTVHMCGLGLAALAALTGCNGLVRLQSAVSVALSGLVLLAVGQWLGNAPSKPQMERVAGLKPTPAIIAKGSSPATTQRLTAKDLYAAVKDPPADKHGAAREDSPPAAASDDSPRSTSLDDLTVAPPDPPRATASSDSESTPTHEQTRIVSLFRDNAQIDVYQHPVIGLPEARHVILKLFDYTCPHCRKMHEHLRKACDEFGGDLVVVMCPAPLNKQCNPHVQFDNPKHAEACELARLALAVWQAEPEKFEEFDAWLFAPPTPPSAASAREKAVELVGETKLAEELYGDNLRERLAVGPKLYQLLGGGTVPKVLLPTGMLVGPGGSSDEVLLELKQEFASASDDLLP